MAAKRIFTLYPFQLILDHLLAIFIICILVILAIESYLPCRETAKLSHVLGSPFIEMKQDMMLFHALHGEWPENNREAMQNGWAKEYGSTYSAGYVERANIEKGAIHFHLGENLMKKVVTLRPAVPDQNPLGPVIWTCGSRRSTSKWSIAGIDKTTVDDRYIPKTWR